MPIQNWNSNSHGTKCWNTNEITSQHLYILSHWGFTHVNTQDIYLCKGGRTNWVNRKRVENVERGRVTKRMMEQMAKDTENARGSEWEKKKHREDEPRKKRTRECIRNPLERDRNRHTEKCINERICIQQWANEITYQRTYWVTTERGHYGTHGERGDWPTKTGRTVEHSAEHPPCVPWFINSNASHDAEPSIPLSWQGLYVRRKWLWNNDWLDYWTRW